MFSDSDSDDEGLISENLRRLKKHSLFAEILFSQSLADTQTHSQRIGRLSLRKNKHDSDSLQENLIPNHPPASNKQREKGSHPLPVSSSQPSSQQNFSPLPGTSSDKDGDSSGENTSDFPSSENQGPPVMLSLCRGRTRQAGQARGSGVKGSRVCGELQDSSEDMVIAETSEEDLDTQTEGTEEERPKVSRGLMLKPSAVPHQSSAAPGSSSFHLPSPICGANNVTPNSAAPVERQGQKKMPLIKTNWRVERLASDEDEDESDEEYFHSKKPKMMAPIHSTPLGTHPAAVSDQQAAGKSLSCSDDEDEDRNDVELPQLTFSSKRKRNESESLSQPLKKCAVPTGSQSGEGRLDSKAAETVQKRQMDIKENMLSRQSDISDDMQSRQSNVPKIVPPKKGEGSGIGLSKHSAPKQSKPEACSSDADNESASSETEGYDNCHKPHEVATKSKECGNSGQKAMPLKMILPEREKLSENQSSEAEVMGEEIQQSEATTVIYEGSTMEYSQLSPSFLEQDTQVADEPDQTEGTLDEVKIINVVSLNPDVLNIHNEEAVQSHNSVNADSGLQTVSREFSTSSDTLPLLADNDSTIVFHGTSAVMGERVALPHLKSEDSDMTQPYAFSDKEDYQGPPCLTAVPSIPSILGRQVSEDLPPPPVLWKVSSSIIPDSSFSATDSNIWPALSHSALEKIKTEDRGSDVTATAGSTSGLQTLPPSEHNFQKHGQPRTLSVTVALPESDNTSQNVKTEQVGLPDQLTILLRLPEKADDCTDLLQSFKTEESPQSQEYPPLLLVKLETETSPVHTKVTSTSNSCDVDDTDSDNSQCLFDDLPKHTTEQGKEFCDDNQRNTESSSSAADAEEDIPIRTLVELRAGLVEQQVHSADSGSTAVRAQQSESGDSEVLPMQETEDRAPDNSDGNLETEDRAPDNSDGNHETEDGAPDNSDGKKVSEAGTNISVSDAVALVKDEPVGYTLEDDFVMVFDSDEEELFTSFTQVEMKHEAIDDLDEDLWSDDITERQYLEIDIDTDHEGADKDSMTADTNKNNKTSAVNNDVAMDTDDDDDLLAASDSAATDVAQKEKMYSLYFQTTLIDDVYEDISTDEDVYLISTQIDDDSVASLKETPLTDEKYEEISSDDDVYEVGTQIDKSRFSSLNETGDDKPGISVTPHSDETGVNTDRFKGSDMKETVSDMKGVKSVSQKPAPEQSEQQDAEVEDCFDDDMDYTLFAAATQLDSDEETALLYSPDSVPGSNALSSDSRNEKLQSDIPEAEKSKQEMVTGNSRTSSDLSSRSESICQDMGSDLVDLTQEGSDQQTAGEDSISKMTNQTEDLQENKEDMKVDKGKAQDIFDHPTLIDEQWLAISDSDDDNSSSGACGQSEPELGRKGVYDAETLGNVEVVSSEEEEEFDLYSMATQRDEDPYFAPTQVDPEIFTVSEESDLETKEEKTDKNETVVLLEDKEGTDVSRAVCLRKQEDLIAGTSETSIIQRRHSAEDDNKSQPPCSSDAQRRVRQHSAEDKSAEDGSKSQPSCSSDAQRRVRQHSAEDKSGSKTTLENQQTHSFVRINSREIPLSSRTLECARETMVEINKKNAKGSVIEIEPLPEARRRGKKRGLHQKLCNAENYRTVPEQEPLEQTEKNSTPADKYLSAEGKSKRQKTSARAAVLGQGVQETRTSSDSVWLRKKPAVGAANRKRFSDRVPKPRKRKNVPGTPISEYTKKARQELAARTKKVILNPSQYRADRRQDAAPRNDCAMDMDVELPSTQEVFDKGLPLLTATMPVSKQRLMRTEKGGEDASCKGSKSELLPVSTAEADSIAKPADVKRDKAAEETKELEVKTNSSRKDGDRDSRNDSGSKMESNQCRDLLNKNSRERHTDLGYSGSKVSSKSSRASQESTETKETVEKSASKHTKTTMEMGHKHRDKTGSGNERDRELGSRKDKAAAPSTSRTDQGKVVRDSVAKYFDKHHHDKTAAGDEKHADSSRSKSSGNKHSVSSGSGSTERKSSKSGSEDRTQHDNSTSGADANQQGYYSKSGSGGASESRQRDMHGPSSGSVPHSKRDMSRSETESLEGKLDRSRPRSGSSDAKQNSSSASGSADVRQDSDSRAQSVERKQGDNGSSSESKSMPGNPAVSFSKVVARPPTPPRTKPGNEPDKTGQENENQSPASDNVQPESHTVKSLPKKSKSVRFDLKRNKYLEPLQFPPQTLPTFQEMLMQKKPASTQPRRPFFQGNPLQKRPAPLQEQQQYVFKPLVPSSAGNSVAGSSSRETGQSARLLTMGDFLFQVLSWSPLWFAEYENFRVQSANVKPDSLTPPPVVDFKELYPLVTNYGDRIEEYQSISFKLLLLETWEELFKSWKEKHDQVPPSQVVLTESTALQPVITLGWTGLLPGSAVRQRHFPSEGDVVVMDMKGRMMLPSDAPNQSSGQVTQSQLGYVERTSLVKCLNVHSFVASNPALMGLPALKQEEQDLWIYKVWVKIRYRRFAPNKDSHTVINPVSSLISSLRRYTALQMLPRSPLMRDILCPSPVASDITFRMPANLLGHKQFNEEQSQAIGAMLSAASQPGHVPKICLLQGPPGTGKSHVLVGLILEILKKNKDPKVCLCAPSNAAADELLRRLVKRKMADRMTFSVVRIGNVDSIHSDVKEFALEKKIMRAKENALRKKKMDCLPQSVKDEHQRLTKKLEKLGQDLEKNRAEKNSKQVDTLSKELRKIQKEKEVIEKNQGHITLSTKEVGEISANELKRAQVVCGTLSSFGQSRIISSLRRNPADNSRVLNHFTCAIIDEATQATELDSLIPLQYGVNKLFLVGDPNQLPPTVLSTKAQSLNFGLSLFERLYKHHHDQERQDRAVMMLCTQYRMDPAICRFPNYLVYDDRLKTDPKIEGYCKNYPVWPYIVFNIEEGQEMQSQSGTLSNEVEAECTAVLCQELIQHKHISAQSIGIICPYAGQKRLVIRKLRERHIERLEVNTVDGFQGREKHIIILSCVRARSSSGGIGFMADRRRMNVALTRAKYALYIIAHLQSLQTDSDWKALVHDAEERGVTQQVHSLHEFPGIIRRQCFKKPVAEAER